MKVRCDHAGMKKCSKGCPHRVYHEEGRIDCWTPDCRDYGVLELGRVLYARVKCVPRRRG